MSSVSSVTSGIPVGSISVSSFSDDIADSSDWHMLLYSDDTNVYLESLINFQNKSIYLNTWSIENDLFNADKTQLLF